MRGNCFVLPYFHHRLCARGRAEITPTEDLLLAGHPDVEDASIQGFDLLYRILCPAPTLGRGQGNSSHDHLALITVASAIRHSFVLGGNRIPG
jgi:hypothetical protein